MHKNDKNTLVISHHAKKNVDSLLGVGEGEGGGEI